MNAPLPPIYRDCQRFWVHTEAVVRHCCAKNDQWEQKHPRFDAVRPGDVTRLQALLGSYWGHFSYGNSMRLCHGLFARFAWLYAYFTLHADSSVQLRRLARWQVLRRQAVRQILNVQGENE